MKEREIVPGKTQTTIKHDVPSKTGGQVFRVMLMYNLTRSRELSLPPRLAGGSGQPRAAPGSWDLFKGITLAWQVLFSKKKSRWLALVLYPFFNPSLIEPCRNYAIILIGLMPGLQAFNYPGCLICPLIALAQDPLPFPLKKFPWHFEI